jgi:hypothetical protein
MIKKIIHTGDIHIRTLRFHDEYKDVFKNFIKDVKELVSGYTREEVRIVVAGDLVHQKIVISNEQLILATWFLRKLEEIAPVILIAGNHDVLENNLGRMDSLSPMVQFLGDKDINYFKESKCYLDENVVWCPYSIFEENARPDIESARTEFGNDKTYIGLFHGPIIGSITDIGYEIEHGYGLEIFEGCDMVMCGDIHSRNPLIYKETKVIQSTEVDKYLNNKWTVEQQEINGFVKVKKNIPVQMSGSLIQQNFGENVSKHGFLFWDIETRVFTEHDVDNNYPYYHFKITSLDDIDNGTEKITNL